MTVSSVPVLDSMPSRRVLVTEPLRENVGFVCRVIEHLYLKEFAWVVDPYDFLQKPLYYISLIEQRQLNRYSRQLGVFVWRLFNQVLPVLSVSANRFVSV